MTRGERLGRGSLVVDAVFCAVVGMVLIGGRRRIARLLGGRAPVAAMAGGGTLAWAVVVAYQASRPDWRSATGKVAAANLGGVLVLMIAASVHPRRRARFVLHRLGHRRGHLRGRAAGRADHPRPARGGLAPQAVAACTVTEIV